MVALDCAAFGPSSQTIGSASSAVFACHQVSATTATVVSLTLTARRTPGLPAILDSSKLTSLPPNTGHALIAAFIMPGIFKSMAKILLPLSLSAVSSLFIGLPAIFHCFGSLSWTLLGSGAVSLAAAA